MCLIMTMLCAATYAGIYFYRKSNKVASKSLLTLVFMHLSASLMWCVDGIASVLEGEGFFDISMEDFILGLIIVGLGLFSYGILIVLEKNNLRKKACI